jgi:predicted enzyme related to lactoylglutathione lyase
MEAIMLTHVKSTCIYSTDVDRTIAFYVDLLGMEKRSDATMGPIRWVELAPAGAETVIAVASEGYPVYSPGKVGGFSGLTLAATEPEQTYARLKEAGITFLKEPERTAWGTQAIIADPDGNQIVIVAS